jgi:hypothetical protein
VEPEVQLGSAGSEVTGSALPELPVVRLFANGRRHGFNEEQSLDERAAFGLGELQRSLDKSVECGVRNRPGSGTLRCHI